MSFEVMEVCVYVLITHLVELLPQQVPLLCVRFAELLFVSDEQREFADWTVQQIFRALFHQLTERLCLWHQHSPGLTDRGRSQWYTSWGHKEKTDKWNSLNVTTWHVGNQLLEPDLLVCSLVGTDLKKNAWSHAGHRYSSLGISYYRDLGLNPSWGRLLPLVFLLALLSSPQCSTKIKATKYIQYK